MEMNQEQVEALQKQDQPATVQKRNPALGTQNLIDKVPKEKKALPPGFYATLVLDLLTFASSIGTGFLYKQYLDGRSSFLAVIIAATLFLLFSMFEMLLIKDLTRRFLILVVSIAGLHAFFYETPVAYLVVSGSVCLALFLWGEFSGRGQLENNLQVRFTKIVKSQVAKSVTALIIAGILMYFPQWSPEKPVLSQGSFDYLFAGSAGITQSLYPELRLNGTVDDFAQSFVVWSIKQKPDDFGAFSSQSAEAQAKAIKESSQKFVDEVSKGLAITVSAQESLSAAAYRYVMLMVSDWQKSAGEKTFYVWAIAAFFVLKGIAIFYQWALVMVGYVVYEILIGFNLIYIVGASRMQELIEFS